MLLAIISDLKRDWLLCLLWNLCQPLKIQSHLRTVDRRESIFHSASATRLLGTWLSGCLLNTCDICRHQFERVHLRTTQSFFFAIFPVNLWLIRTFEIKMVRHLPLLILLIGPTSLAKFRQSRCPTACPTRAVFTGTAIFRRTSNSSIQFTLPL